MIEELLERHLASGKLSFDDSVGGAVHGADAIFIAVGTPSSSGGDADLSQVIRAAEGLVTSISSYAAVVVKSTVPVGTLGLIRETLGSRLREGADFDVAVNPEFLREGKALHDFLHPTRLVVGTTSQRAASVMRGLYAPLLARLGTPVPYIDTDEPSAQMIKYAANAFLATRISFINEIADICERVGADVASVRSGIGCDPRIGSAYLDPGLGFGGPCLEKDLRAVIRLAESADFDPLLFRSVLERNQRQLRVVQAKLKARLGEVLHGKTVAVLGLAFKPQTADVRNSQAMKLVTALLGQGANVRGHDPVATKVAEAMEPEASYWTDPYAAASGADGLVIATEWPEYASLDFERVGDAMRAKVVIDARNLLDPCAMRELGFIYEGVGVS